ncbi:sulfite exporter TauE/SafE family protein [Carpediemonas membranifera]|uniref:Sulfite exporter TauE/SafE family protein n=1 Tax=Carpediemonas membranifera TaxID=201153 RepID=A0A8J6B431_9EUKA|nr:sulfite exporter TauE/SafE family protein [Carpediemonas membranifera]|eukprot:KAG9389607.1 sulfite exporter TauE/SafE family protein [Carpediemonas membranifera]
MLLEEQLSFLNDADPILSLWLFVTGFFVGCIAALFGVGGGTVTVPAMTILFGVDGLAATNISTGAIVFTSTNSFYKMVRQRRVSFAAGIPFVIFAVPGSIIGSLLATFIPRASILQATFSVFMLSLAIIKLTSIGGSTLTKLLRVIRKRRGAKVYPAVDGSTAGTSVIITIGTTDSVTSDSSDSEETLDVTEVIPDDDASQGSAAEINESDEEPLDSASEDGRVADGEVSVSLDEPVSTQPESSLFVGHKGSVPRMVAKAYCSCLKMTLRRPWRVHHVALPDLDEPMMLWPTLPLCTLAAAMGAFIGMSGGVIFVPLLTMLAKLPAAKAIPVSTMAIWFSIWFAAATRLLLASMDFYYVVPIGIGSVFGSSFALNSFGKLDSGVLLAVFWLLCMSSALQMGYVAVEDLFF